MVASSSKTVQLVFHLGYLFLLCNSLSFCQYSCLWCHRANCVIDVILLKMNSWISFQLGWILHLFQCLTAHVFGLVQSNYTVGTRANNWARERVEQLLAGIGLLLLLIGLCNFIRVKAGKGYLEQKQFSELGEDTWEKQLESAVCNYLPSSSRLE